jgi:hypothetical protein
MEVTGTVTLASPLLANQAFVSITPLSYSFSDGVQTLASGAVSFQFSTDASASITGWRIFIDVMTASSNNAISTSFTPGQEGDSGQIQTCISAPQGCSGYLI